MGMDVFPKGTPLINAPYGQKIKMNAPEGNIGYTELCGRYGWVLTPHRKICKLDTFVLFIATDGALWKGTVFPGHSYSMYTRCFHTAISNNYFSYYKYEQLETIITLLNGSCNDFSPTYI